MGVKQKFSFESSSLKSLFSDSIVYGVSSAVNRLTILIILPLYAKTLPPNVFININLITNFFVLINILLLFGLDNAIAISYYNSDSSEYRKQIFSSWFWFEFIINLVLFFLFIFNSGAIINGLTHSNESNVFNLAATAQLFSFPLYILSFWYRLQRKPLSNLFIVSTNGLILLLLNIYYLKIAFKGIQGYFISLCISSFFVSIICVYLLKDWIKPSLFNFTLIFTKLKASLGMLLANISSWFVSFSSIYFIQFLIADKALAGIYQIALLINTIVSFIVNAFAQALGPYVQSIKKNKELAITKYQKIFKLYILLVGFLTMSISVFSKEIVLIISSDQYSMASDVLFLVCFSTFLNGLSYIGGIGFVVGNRVNLNKFGILSTIGTLLNIVFFVILIPKIGILGAAISSFISSLILNIIVYYNANKYLIIKYNFKFGIIMILLYFAISFLSMKLEDIMVSQYYYTILKVLCEVILIFVVIRYKYRLI